jgi:hypothetical protein
MDIHLDTIRALLRPTLGYDSFAAGFISAVKPDSGIPTACINAKGVLRYNPEFVARYVRTEADLFCLVFHELLHPAFGHFVHGADELTNIACDAIINSVIANLFREESASGCLFEAFYPERGLSAILRPRSKLSYSRYRRLYELLYPSHSSGRTRLSAGEVIQTLKALAPNQQQHIVLLGSHTPSGDGAGAPREDTGWPDKITAKVSREILQAIRSSGTSAGYFDNLIDLIVEVLKTKSTIREDLLLGYATRKKLDSFFDEQQRPRRITSPFPLNPSRRDMVLLTAGIWPGLFRNRQPEVTQRRKGIAIYLDVSGSVNDHLPEILGVLVHYRNRIGTIYQFSNRVAEVSFDRLCSGRVHTTYGTDFDCVARSILENEYENAVVITDGYADLDEANAVAFKKGSVCLLTILFGGAEGCKVLEPFGDLLRLDEIRT